MEAKRLDGLFFDSRPPSREEELALSRMRAVGSRPAFLDPGSIVAAISEGTSNAFRIGSQIPLGTSFSDPVFNQGPLLAPTNAANSNVMRNVSQLPTGPSLQDAASEPDSVVSSVEKFVPVEEIEAINQSMMPFYSPPSDRPKHRHSRSITSGWNIFIPGRRAGSSTPPAPHSMGRIRQFNNPQAYSHLVPPRTRVPSEKANEEAPTLETTVRGSEGTGSPATPSKKRMAESTPEKTVGQGSSDAPTPTSASKKRKTVSTPKKSVGEGSSDASMPPPPPKQGKAAPTPETTVKEESSNKSMPPPSRKNRKVKIPRADVPKRATSAPPSSGDDEEDTQEEDN